MTEHHASGSDEFGETLDPIPALTEDEYLAEVLRSAPSSGVLAQPYGALVLGALGLAADAGKVADLVKEHCFHGRLLEQAALLDELGEVLWSLTWLCHVLDTSLGAVMLGNITKLRARSPHGVDPERSRGRSSRP